MQTDSFSTEEAQTKAMRNLLVPNRPPIWRRENLNRSQEDASLLWETSLSLFRRTNKDPSRNFRSSCDYYSRSRGHCALAAARVTQMDCGGTGLASHRAGLRRAALNRNGALLGLVIFPATFLASVLGYVNLANLLGNGALKSAYVAAALDAAFRIVEGLIIIALRARPLALSRVVRLHRSLLQRRLCGIARFLAVLVWLSLTLKFFALQDSLMRYGGAALEAKLTIGFLNISLGQVLVFIVTGSWTSLLVSKFVRFLLEEDVYHHWRVERGIPQAISTMVHYTVLLVGFFVALAVLGVDLTKITILAGAFTVGIGFGLQTVINNFVCGLILLFERPIKSRRCGAGRCGCRRGSADRDPGVRHPHGE